MESFRFFCFCVCFVLGILLLGGGMVVVGGAGSLGFGSFGDRF